MSKHGSGIAPDDDVKAKFREALAKKQAKSASGSSGDGDRQQVHGTHGAETSARQQMFRRKSC